MEIRELNMSDIESVKRLMIDIFSVEPWNDVWTDDKLHAYIRELMGNENSLSFGVYQDEVLIGIALGRLKSWYEGTEYWIDEFGILPKMQQAGIGSGFMKSIEEKAAEREPYTSRFLQRNRCRPISFTGKTGFRKEKKTYFL